MKRLLLRTPEVRDLLAGKVVLRRPVKPQPNSLGLVEGGREILGWKGSIDKVFWSGSTPLSWICPLGAPGERRWVGEEDSLFRCWDLDCLGDLATKPEGAGLWCSADAPKPLRNGRTRSAVTMPQFASRLTAEVVSVGLEQIAGTWCWVVEVKRVD